MSASRAQRRAPRSRVVTPARIGALTAWVAVLLALAFVGALAGAFELAEIAVAALVSGAVIVMLVAVAIVGGVRARRARPEEDESLGVESPQPGVESAWEDIEADDEFDHEADPEPEPERPEPALAPSAREPAGTLSGG